MIATKEVRIHEVGPRDGFQSVSTWIPTEVKLQTIDALVASGVKSIQICSFVNPKAVPQMADSAEVAKQSLERHAGSNVVFSALVPNRRGTENAIACGLKRLNYVTSATESHNMANVKKTIAESTAILAELIREYPEVEFTWDVSMAFGCIFEGAVSYEKLKRHISSGMEIGAREFNLCDTNGTATPNIIRDRVARLLADFPEARFRVHVHDTRNMGMLNTFAAIECGITDVEVSIGGLGGCPFSPGASGNTSTEDLVYMLNSMGYKTDIEFEKLLDAAKFVRANVDGVFSGHQINITDRCKQQ